MTVASRPTTVYLSEQSGTLLSADRSEKRKEKGTAWRDGTKCRMHKAEKHDHIQKLGS